MKFEILKQTRYFFVIRHSYVLRCSKNYEVGVGVVWVKGV